MSDSVLSDTAFLDAFLNVAVPPDESRSLPGAGDLGLASAVVTGLQSDAMLGPMAESGLRAVRDAALAQHPDGLTRMAREAASELVQTTLSSSPFVMMGLLRYVYPAYYQHPDVLRGIGEEPRPPFPQGFTVEPTDPALLDALRARAKTSPGR
jgi:hypothetical protein